MPLKANVTTTAIQAMITKLQLLTELNLMKDDQNKNVSNKENGKRNKEPKCVIIQNHLSLTSTRDTSIREWILLQPVFNNCIRN